jgi:hypothetical protein
VQDLAYQDEQALRAQLGRARERLESLVRDLHVIDVQLEGLSAEREYYRLLGQVCSGLEELSKKGAARLFWGEHLANSGGDEHVRQVRGRVAAFEKRVDEIECRRQAVLEAIEHAQDDSDLIAEDVLEAQRREEQRRLEWVVEREVDVLPARPPVMPWTRGGEEDERFRKSLAAALLLSLLLGLLFPMIDLPRPEPWEPVEVPERLTRLLAEERPLPPPPPVREETRPEETEPEPTDEKVATPEPTPKPQKTAASKGILAFREKFSGLAEARPAARLGAQARISSSGEAASGPTQRSLVTVPGQASSGGINVAALSRDIGSGGEGKIERVQVARATSSIGAVAGEARPLSDGPGLSRTDEEIQIVFDRHKAALYRLYNRELRRDPTLKGQMVLRMTIEPDGSVSLCEVNSTDMKAPTLSAQVVERVKTFDFGAKDGIPAITILYPIDFLPAT